MQIRKYRPSDCRELAELFYDTVHTVNAGDYTKEQLDAWTTGHVDLEAWDRSFRDMLNHCLYPLLILKLYCSISVNFIFFSNFKHCFSPNPVRFGCLFLLPRSA